MKVRFETTGCRLNQIESEAAARFFLDKNISVSLESVSSSSLIDEETRICVLNTCAVTKKAEQKDRRLIRLLLSKFPNSTVIVTGCYAQLSQDEIKSIDKRIAVLPGQLKSRIKNVVDLFIEEASFNCISFAEKLQKDLFCIPNKVLGKSEDSFALSTDSFLVHSRSSIKIQDGCNNNCTYCAIHIARGKSVSLSAEEVIERIKKLEQKGQNEVVFTSVNIGQYRGFYKDSYINFTQLLELCLKETNKINFRISSLYPEVIDDYFCSVIKNNRVRPHFHISVQSGSDKILSLMGRKYKAMDVKNACDKLRNSKNNPFIACDIITGFPCETEEDFNQTLELCKSCDFTWVHVFPYSERPGTEAVKMKNKVPQSVSGKRAKELSAWAFNQKQKYIQNCKNKVFSGILEVSRRTPLIVNEFHGVTENFLHCKVINSFEKNYKAGEEVKFKIIDAVEENLVKGGEIECLAKIF